MTEDMFSNKSERGVEKAIEISAKPISDFDPVRISIELTSAEVQALNLLYNMMNPKVVPDMKALAKYMITRGMDTAFAEVKKIMDIQKIIGMLPPELRDLLGGFDKGGPKT